MKYTLIAGIAAFASTTIATMFACYRMLRATPAKLMRPKSPKEGKKIFSKISRSNFGFSFFFCPLNRYNRNFANYLLFPL